MNDFCIDDLYTESTYPENDHESHLQHHGILGQRWGKRHAEWYPIADYEAHLANTEGPKAAKSFRESVEAAYKKHKKDSRLRKARKAKAKKAAAAKREEIRTVKSEAKKQKILRGGTPGDIIKIRSILSDQEIADAVLRNANINKLREAENIRLQQISDAEWEKKYGKYRKLFSAAKSGVELTNNIANTVEKVEKIINGPKKKFSNPLDVLANPGNYSDDDVKDAMTRAQNIKNIRDSYKDNKEPTIEEILKNPKAFSSKQVSDVFVKARNIDNLSKMTSDSVSNTDVYKQQPDDKGSNSAATNNATSKYEDIINSVDKDVLNTPMSEVKNKKYSYEEALDYWLNDQPAQFKHSEREREIAAKVKEEGYSSLTNQEKEIYDEAYK